MEPKDEWIELVREFFPDISRQDAMGVLWNYTGFPAFWNIPADGATPLDCCRKQLAEFKAEAEVKPDAVDS